MNKFEYRPGKTVQEPIKLDGPTTWVGTADNVRSREWSYELGYRDVMSATRPAREVECAFYADYATADKLRRAADADMQAMTPGTFVAQGEWKQRGYVLASQTSMVHFGRLETTLRLALLDGAWWRLVTRSFAPSDDQTPSPYLDYAYDYEYDYKPTRSSSVESSVLTSSDVHIVFYGPATNPAVTVGGNKYEVDVVVPSGGYVTIDGREKTIVLTLADGSTQNAFAYGLRGSGQGGGEYVFEPLKSGLQVVSMTDSPNFDFGWYEEEGEPPWSQS